VRPTATFHLVTRSCLGEPLSRVRAWRRTIVFERINSQSFASSEYSVSLQSLQHLQAGLLEDTRCFGEKPPLNYLVVSSLFRMPACFASFFQSPLGFSFEKFESSALLTFRIL